MTVVCIGVFDGVHLGHQKLFEKTKEIALEKKLKSIALTFNPHPATVLKPEATLWLLNTIEDRIKYIHDTGCIDDVEIINFDLEMSKMSAENFVTNILLNKLNTKVVVVGENFNFGKDRKGNAQFLRSLGIEVIEVPLLIVDSEPVSSTRIRRLLLEGKTIEAQKLLTRYYQVEGIVEHGDKRGRELGFPTANIAIIESLCLPSDGVYAGWASVEGDPNVYKAAISIGRRPTFYEKRGLRLLETHIIDFQDEIYGKKLITIFGKNIREQVKFNSVEELIEQIKLDVLNVRYLLD